MLEQAPEWSRETGDLGKRDRVIIGGRAWNLVKHYKTKRQCYLSLRLLHVVTTQIRPDRLNGPIITNCKTESHDNDQGLALDTIITYHSQYDKLITIIHYENLNKTKNSRSMCPRFFES